MLETALWLYTACTAQDYNCNSFLPLIKTLGCKSYLLPWKAKDDSHSV